MEAMDFNTAVEDTDVHQMIMPLRASFVDYTDWVMIDPEEGTSSSSLFDMSLLPEEILERILSYLSPYKDMDTVKLVSKQWHRVLKSVVKHIRRNFNHRLVSCNVNWTQLVHEVPETDPRHKVIRSLSISERFFHSAAYVNESMYVFGGISSTNTTFNDLWRLDLTTRRWVRPVAMGSYPSPKAKATMVVYKDKLYLFGGWSQPTPTPLHQSSNFFSELHEYDPISNRWSLLVTIGPEPEPLAGHSASVVSDLMVVFGGTASTEQGSNKVWLYDFLKCTWSNPVLSGIQPEPRHNQFQCTIDDQHVLIMGGTYGARLNARKFSDVYILTMHPWDPWYWTKLTVLHPELTPELSLCYSQCKVNDTVVVLDLCNKPREAKNEKPRIMRVEPLSRFNSHNGSSTTSTPKPRLVPQEPPQLHNIPPPQPQHPQKPHSSQATPQENGCCCCAAERLGSQSNEVEGDAGAAAVAAGQPSSSSSMSSLSAGPSNNNRSLLALQQRLHRDYINLPDRDNHHHKPQGEDNDVADSHIERLQNRQHQQQQQGEGGGAPPPHNCQRNAPQPPPQQHDVQQQEQQQQHQHNCDSPNLPKVGTGQGASANGHHPAPPSCRHQAAPPCRHHAPNNMPSIRPNATSNRQRQLEALQRHEELLRSRSRALAAARFKKGSSSSGSSSSACASSVDEAEPPPPPTIMTKDRLDIYTLDLSRAVTESTVEWKPLSQIQPPGAPTEAFRCTLVVGRGELIMFGGIRRDKSSPRETSVTQNNVYFLHP